MGVSPIAPGRPVAVEQLVGHPRLERAARPQRRRSSCCSPHRRRTRDRPRIGPRSTCRRETTLEPETPIGKSVSCRASPPSDRQADRAASSHPGRIQRAAVCHPEKMTGEPSWCRPRVICRSPDAVRLASSRSRSSSSPVSSSYRVTVNATLSPSRAHRRRADKCGAVVIRDLEPALAVLRRLPKLWSRHQHSTRQTSESNLKTLTNTSIKDAT